MTSATAGPGTQAFGFITDMVDVGHDASWPTGFQSRQRNFIGQELVGMAVLIGSFAGRWGWGSPLDPGVT